MRVGSLTDVGREREHNEDNFLTVRFSFGTGRRHIEYALCVVADGMGGAAAGEVASRLTVETIGTLVYQTLLNVHLEGQGYVNPSHVIRDAMEQGNQRVFITARETPQLLGMGATCTSMVLCQGKAFIGQVGDSRAYLLRAGELRQVTRDHSFVGELVRDGRITEEQARNHPRKNIITRAIGSRYHVQVDTFLENLQPGDVLLSCSDGLSGMVTDEELKSILTAGTRGRTGQQKICEELVARANAAGGTDNITVTVVEVEPDDIALPRLDHVCLDPDQVLTWGLAAELGLEDFGFSRVDS